jgi:hypothetical protein
MCVYVWKLNTIAEKAAVIVYAFCLIFTTGHHYLAPPAATPFYGARKKNVIRNLQNEAESEILLVNIPFPMLQMVRKWYLLAVRRPFARYYVRSAFVLSSQRKLHKKY